LAVETFEYGYQGNHEVPVQVPPLPPAQPTTQPTVQETPEPIAQPDPFTKLEPVHVAPTPTVTPAPAPAQPQTVEQVVQSDGFDDTFDTSSWNSSEASSSQTAPRPTQSIDASFVAEATAPADHSLELVIMRDEIQDLRNRLDSSQKLVEEMMHKLANLAELALRSRM
jgi:outer membrane biosynthesis protein TonB